MATPLKPVDNTDRRRLEKRAREVFDSADNFVVWMEENYGIPHRHTIRSVVRLIPTKNAFRAINARLAAVKKCKSDHK